MNAATKLTLASILFFAVVLVTGLGLIAHGSNAMDTGLGKIVTGIALLCVGCFFGGIFWRNRP